MSIKDFLDIVEIRTKVVSMATLVTVTAYVFHVQGSMDPLRWTLLVLAALLVDMGTTGFNTWFDYWNGTDSIAYNMEPEKILVHKQLHPTDALHASLACYALALVPGLILVCLCGPWLLFWGALCMLVGFCYTGGPWPISRTSLGEFFAGGFLGGILFLLGIRILGISWDTQAIVASMPLSFWIGAILAFNNACDLQGDRSSGRKTFAVVFGARKGIVWAYSWVLAGIAAELLVHVLNWTSFSWWGLLCCVVSSLAVLPTLSHMYQGGFSHARKGPTMKGILKIFLILSTAYSLSWISGRLLILG